MTLLLTDRVDKVAVELDQLMRAAMRLAADMALNPAETLATYKRIIDNGYDLALGDALVLERQLSNTHNRSVTAGAVAARREAIQARGRSQ
jgi:enoyl-CoA hydratase